jgi:MoxR-like ATPase
MEIGKLQEVLGRIREETAKVIIGQEEVVELALATILSGQHALIEGVPGIGKTLLVRTLAKILGDGFGRIQFTPDLMPADITGTHVFNLKTQEFSLVQGPVFTGFLLADEINRAPAKTQSALLQSMQERTVSIDRNTYRLSPNFTVFATQNPIEFEGTYPLPEAQKDRFMVKIAMQGPSLEEERRLARSMLGEKTPEQVLSSGDVQRQVDAETLPAMRAALRQVRIKDELVDYIVNIVRATRNDPRILVGGGPRATQSLILGARAMAVIAGRDFSTPEDIKRLAVPVLEHRLVLRPEYEIEGLTPDEVVSSLLEGVTVPR